METCKNSSLLWSKLAFNFDNVTLEEFSNLLLNYLFWKYFISFVGIFTLWYYLFWRPFNLIRDFTEFGYSDVINKSKGSDAMKKNLINELRRKRKIGEVPPNFPNGWYVILESRDLKINSSMEINCLGLTLVAWRGESGKSYVSDAYCPHLGSHLGVGGQVAGESIVCPFHAWKFEGNHGKCIDIPYSNSIPEVAKINIHETIEMNGFIYLWNHAEGEKPHWKPDPIPEIASGEWKFRGRSEFRVACHVQEIAENGSDMNHLNVVHKSAILTGGKPMEATIKWGFLTHRWYGAWEANSDPKLAHKALMTLDHEMCLFNRIPFLKLKVQANQVGAGLVYLIFEGLGGKGVLFFNVTPLEPLLQKISHSFYSSNTLIHPLGMLILLGEAVQLERDIGIWNRKTYLSRPLLTKEDKSIKAFRRWFNQFYSESSIRYNSSEGNNNRNLNARSKDLSF